MKEFMKTVLASALGCIMAAVFMSFVFTFLIIAFVAGIMMFSPSKDNVSYAVQDKTVMILNVEGELNERRVYADVVRDMLSEERQLNMGLYEIGRALQIAANDDRISGLYLRLRWLNAGWGKTEALRELLKNFKKSGKFIYAYSEAYDERLYYLASVADEIFMYPEGEFEWNGIYSKLGFFKKTLGKLEIEPTLIRAGKFKSAGEAIVREDMSEANRLQMTELTSSIWNHILKNISESREGVTIEILDDLAKKLTVQDAQQAYNNGLVTQLLPIEEVEKKILKVTGLKEEDKPRLVNWLSYYQSEDQRPFLRRKDKVAVLVANGEIYLGKGDVERSVFSDEMSIIIRELSKDEKVKALVLRVNSPGGSALASDVIWRSLEYFKKKNKKLVSSFSDVAASGGYYIAAGSDYILAEPTTVTGSIGVFGMLFDTSEFFENKLGVTFDEVKTHEHADYMTGRALMPYEKQKIQESVDDVYKTFLYVVQQGRPQYESPEHVIEVAEGRIWSGLQAIDNGLVDGLGSLDDAVVKAAELAKLKDYDVVVYPDQKRWLDRILETLGETWTPTWVRTTAKNFATWINYNNVQRDKVLTRLPFLMEMN